MSFRQPIFLTLLVFFPATIVQGQVDTDAIPALRQPGDDISPELSDNLNKKQKAEAEALAKYMEGLSLQKQGNLEDARDAFRQAIDLDPKSPEPYKALALLSMRLGRESEATELATKVAELDKDDFDIRLQLALLTRRGGNPRAAIRLIEEALASKDLNPKSQDALRIHTFRAALQLEAREIRKAASSFDTILDALERPEDFGLDFRQHQAMLRDRSTNYQTIGQIMLQIGRYQRAITAFQGMARLDDNRPGQHNYFLALANFRIDKLNVAIEQLNKLFQGPTRRPEALRLLIDVYRAANREAEIADKLKAMMDDASDPTVVQMQLANFYVEQDNTDAADEIFQQVLNETSNAEAHIGLLLVAIAKQDTDLLQKRIRKATRARITAAELRVLIPKVMSTKSFARSAVEAAVADTNTKRLPAELFFFALLAEELEELSQQATLLQATLNARPDPDLTVDALSKLAFSYLLQDENEKAAVGYRQLLAYRNLSDGQRVMFLYRLSQAELFQDNHAAALTALFEADRMAPGNPELQFQLGLVHLDKDEFGEAEGRFRNALQGSINLPNSDLQVRTQLLLGSLYSQIRNWPKAVRSYQSAGQAANASDEQQRQAKIGLSNAYVRNDQFEKGLQVLENMHATDPDDPGINNDLGYLYADHDMNLEEAERMIRLAVKAEPNNNAFWDSLGWVLYKLEKYDEALEALKKANADQANPDSTLLEHLGDVQSKLGDQPAAQKSWQKSLEVEKQAARPDPDVLQRLKEKLKTEER